MWLNNKHLEEGFDHKQLREITIKYYPDHRRNRYETVKEPKKQCTRAFINDQVILEIKWLWIEEQYQPINSEQD